MTGCCSFNPGLVEGMDGDEVQKVAQIRYYQSSLILASSLGVLSGPSQNLLVR
jgi:hypothetical protein